MSEEEKQAYLEEKARKEAEARAAAEAKARAEETKAETVRVRVWRNVGLRCAALVNWRHKLSASTGCCHCNVRLKQPQSVHFSPFFFVPYGKFITTIVLGSCWC